MISQKDQQRTSTPYRLLKTLQDNHRYKVSLIEQDGEERILKQCNDPELASMLHHDVQSSFYLEAVRSYNIESVFRVRQIYSYGNDWHIGEKLHGEILFPHETKRSLEDEIKIAEELYAPFIYETCIYTPQVMLGKHPYVNEQGTPNKDFHTVIGKMREWADIAVKGRFIKKDEAELIIDFIQKHLKEVRYGIELYDLEPWEIFLLPDYRIGIIDLEYTNLRGRRHFDMAYNYMRLWLDVKRPRVAMATLRRYKEIAKEEDMDNAFLSLFGIKLMGYLMDAARWMKDTKEKGKPVIYSHKETRELLNRYLTFSIKELTKE
jgi:hypothetical protein